MGRWVRFVVSKTGVLQNRTHPGVFTAAQHLLDRDVLEPHESENLTELMEWFRVNLPVPPLHDVSPQAIFWYSPSAEEIISKMWELAHILNEYDYNASVMTACYIGRVVYRDNLQIAAIPHEDRFG